MMPMTQTIIAEHRSDVWKVEEAAFDSDIDIDQFPVPIEAVAAIDGLLRKIQLAEQ